ncbi:MAG: LuxR C-terminal-related transcriptional regulator, partial [Acidimicrobiales bacterium]
ASCVRRLLSDFAGDTLGAELCSMGVADDPRGMATVLGACIDDESQFAYLRFRFNPPSGPSVSTKVVITGCGDLEGVGPAAVVPIRNISPGNSLAAFINHVADIPDGDTPLNAMRWGPLAALPAHSMYLYSVHQEARQLRLVGAFNWSDVERRECSVNPLDDSHPGGATCLRTEIIWLPLPKLVARFPLVARSTTPLPFFEVGEAISLPVTSRGTVIGSLFIMLRESVQQTAARLDQLAELCQVLAPWVLIQREAQQVPKSAPRPRHYELNERGITILRFVEQGLSNNEVTDELGCSEATVRADLSRLHKLLGANGRREIVRKARDSGLYEV